jgi:hypothetical protein
MRKQYFTPFFLVLLLTPAIGLSQTTISGEVYDGNGGPLTLAGSPYVVPSTVSIPSQQTLTIQPGVEIRLEEGAMIDISGSLSAEGTEINRIRFTSGAPGQMWYYLIFRSGSTGSLKFCDIENGGQFNNPQLLLQDPQSLVIDQCIISNSSGDGLQGYIGSSIAGSLSITNSSFNNNADNGVDLIFYDQGTITINNNTLSNNGNSAYRLGPNIYPFNSTLSGNGFDGIELTGGTVNVSGTYINDLLTDSWITVQSGISVTISPGVNIYMKEGAAWDISGDMFAEGTTVNRIRFTSHTPEQIWYYIIFRSGSTGSLKFCDVENGGQFNNPQLLLQDPQSLVIDQCIISNSSGDGLQGYIGSSIAGSLSITNSSFNNNTNDGVDLALYDQGTATVDNNSLANNGNSAFRLGPNIYPSGTILSGNGFDGIELTGGTNTISGTYFIDLISDGWITIASGVGVTISPGVNIYMNEGISWDISGSLSAEGTSLERIRFTSSTPEQRWYYIIFRSGSTGSLKFCDVEKGGQFNNPQLLLQDPQSLVIDQCKISNSGGDGLQGYVGSGITGSLTITNSSFDNNADNGVDLTFYDQGTITIDNNSLSNNGNSAFRLGPNIYPSNSTLSGNGFDGIELTGGTINSSGTYFNDLLTDSWIAVQSGVTVTISPGVNIYMKEDAAWDISGSILAEGTALNKIRITSYTPGLIWYYIIFRSGSSGSLKFCDIEDGGRYNYPMLYLQDPSSLIIDQCTVTKSSGDGLQGYLGSGTAGNLIITNSSFNDNTDNGIDLTVYENGVSVITNNTLKNNRGAAYRLSTNIYPSGGDLESNAFDGIELTGGTISVSGTYVIDLLVEQLVSVNSGVSVTLTPGLTAYLKESAGIDISGNLIAEGTSNNRIRFTSSLPGESWYYIIFRSGSSGSFKYCDIEYGGQFETTQIYLQDPANLTIDQSVISNSGGDGIQGYIGNSTQVNFSITNSWIIANNNDGIDLYIGDVGFLTLYCNTISSNGEDGIKLNSNLVSIQNNKISNNAGCAFNNTGWNDINLQNNWWGSSSGPGGIGSGNGDELCSSSGGTFTFEPWSEVPYFLVCGDSLGSPYITRVSPDTVIQGKVTTLFIYGGNFDTSATVRLSRGLLNKTVVGDIAGTILSNTYNLIIANFDLTAPESFGRWELIVQNGDGNLANYPVFIDLSIIWADFDWDGIRGFPILPVGNSRSNYLAVYNMGNSDGLLWININPPDPGFLRLRVGQDIWNSENEEDKTIAHLLVPLLPRKEISIPLWWGISPEDVFFPPDLAAAKSLLDGHDNRPAFGQNRQVTANGLGGAARDQAKGMLISVLINSVCSNLGDQIRSHYGQGGDPNLLDNVLDAIMKELKDAQDPTKMVKTLASHLLQIPGWVGIAQSIVECAVQLVGDFMNSWQAHVKQQADMIRGDDEAQARLQNRISSEWRGRLTARTALIKALTEEPPCSQAPANNQTWNGQIVGPWDPNDKSTVSSYPCEYGIVNDSVECVRFFIPLENANDMIEYVIRFENKKEATAPAENVVITDVLDSSFVHSTLQIISTSHPETFSFEISGNTVSFSFSGINLPPNEEPPEGEGFVRFAVSPKLNLPLGTEIRNKASIVFDFNPPILTPEVVHTIGAPEIAASKSIVTFPLIEPGQTFTDTIWLKNVGGYKLAIWGIAPVDMPFAVTSDFCSNTVLDLNDSCSVLLEFIPNEGGMFTDTLFVLSSDLMNYPYAIQLAGSAVTDVEPELTLPKVFRLMQSYPNPFNPVAVILYDLPVTSRVTLEVYNVVGQLVATLIDDTQYAGYKSVEWNAGNLSSGVYFYRLTAQSDAKTFTEVKKMLLVK